MLNLWTLACSTLELTTMAGTLLVVDLVRSELRGCGAGRRGLVSSHLLFTSCKRSAERKKKQSSGFSFGASLLQK